MNKNNLIVMDDPTKLKITNIKGYRINFRYDGVLYSLNDMGDCGEYWIDFCNWDTKEVIGQTSGTIFTDDYIRDKRGRRTDVYSHIDKQYLIERLHAEGLVYGGRLAEYNCLCNEIEHTISSRDFFMDRMNEATFKLNELFKRKRGLINELQKS